MILLLNRKARGMDKEIQEILHKPVIELTLRDLEFLNNININIEIKHKKGRFTLDFPCESNLMFFQKFGLDKSIAQALETFTDKTNKYKYQKIKYISYFKKRNSRKKINANNNS